MLADIYKVLVDLFPFILLFGVLYIVTVVIKSFIKVKQFIGNEKAYYYEIIKTDPYDHTSFFAYILGLVMALCFIYYSLNSSSIETIANINDFQFILPAILFSIPFYIAFVVLYFFIKDILTINTYKTIYKKGIRVSGRIKSISTESYRSYRRLHTTFYLGIEYFSPETGAEKNFLTPSVKFNPNLYLGSVECTVYLYKNKVLAYDFLTEEDTGAGVSIPIDNTLANEKRKRESIAKLILFILALITSALILKILF